MFYSSRLIVAIAITGFTGLASASAIQDYNMILFDDFSASGGSGHVHGNAFIGGDLNGQNPEFGADLSKSTNIDTLEVAGDLNANQVTVQAGYLAYGGSNNLGSINCNGNGLSGGSCLKAVSGLDTKAVDLFNELNNYSDYYTGLTTNGSVDLVDKKLSYSGSASDLAIFNLDGSDLFAQNSNWDLDFGAADKVVINVSGENLASAGGINLNGGFSEFNAANILWNFYDADSINLGSTKWIGSILAIEAVLDAANDLNGTLVADSYIGNGQIHIANWTDEPPTGQVPEPGVILLMLTGLGLLGLGQQRRS